MATTKCIVCERKEGHIHSHIKLRGSVTLRRELVRLQALKGNKKGLVCRDCAVNVPAYLKKVLGQVPGSVKCALCKKASAPGDIVQPVVLVEMTEAGLLRKGGRACGGCCDRFGRLKKVKEECRRKEEYMNCRCCDGAIANMDECHWFGRGGSLYSELFTHGMIPKGDWGLICDGCRAALDLSKSGEIMLYKMKGDRYEKKMAMSCKSQKNSKKKKKPEGGATCSACGSAKRRGRHWFGGGGLMYRDLRLYDMVDEHCWGLVCSECRDQLDSAKKTEAEKYRKRAARLEIVFAALHVRKKSVQ